MTCYHPLKAFLAKEINRSGKRSIVFTPNLALTPDQTITLPCGKCIGCRLERSRQWAIRCIHEAKLHRNNCFVTLTYDEKNLPSDGSLQKRDWQLFAKRLRKQAGKFRFYMCGEYGDETSRPHFHACMFGYRPNDLRVYKRSFGGDTLYNSDSLQKIWGKGHAVIGELTFESAAYVARYVMKKVTGKTAQEHYERVDKNGECYQILPEYNQASLKPAIGKEWLEKNKNYVQAHDFVIMNGRKIKPPKYYDKLLDKENPIQTEYRKELRKIAAIKITDNSEERLQVKELVHEAQVKNMKRNSQ